MKKILSILVIFGLFIFSGLKAFADDAAEAKAFFNSYVNAANTYSPSIPSFYSPNAKIIRQVVKPDGSLANAYTNTSTYMKQLKLGQATAKIRKYKKACSIAACDETMDVDEETISKISGLDIKKINEVKNAIKKEPVSLDTFVTDDLCIQDYVEDTSYSSPENSTQKKLQQKDITRLLKTLDTREREIIKRRFGIDNEEPKTLEQIGNDLGFSKERIRQLETIALQKLRKVERIETLRTYLEDEM